MNSKFKPGDRVWIVSANRTNGKYGNGDTGALVSLYGVCWTVRINGTELLIGRSEMEPIEEPTVNRLKGLKLKFDVTDNPELSKAIQRRLVELGARTHSKFTFEDKTTALVLSLETVYPYTGTYSIENHRGLKLATLDDLYRLPKPKAKIITPEGKEIELSDDAWESVRENVL